MISTIDDMHRFTEMFRRGGELDGTRILSPAMIRYAARLHTGSMVDTGMTGYRKLRNWVDYPANIGIGFRVRGENMTPGPFGVLNSPGTFGHFGAGSTGVWVDPEHDLAYTFLSTGLLEETHSQERTGMLSDLVMSALVG